MQQMDHYNYEDYNTEHIKKIRIPQQTWLQENHDNSRLMKYKGIVSSFNINTGNGYIETADLDEPVFFNFTAIPGEGYRTVRQDAEVTFELVETHTGLSARNVQQQ